MSPRSRTRQHEIQSRKKGTFSGLRFIADFLAVALLAGNLNGQLPGGLITGQARDADTLQGLKGVHVSIRNANGNWPVEVSTDASGSFQFLAIPPDFYELTFQKAGYLSVVVRSVSVISTRTSSVPVIMQHSQRSDQDAIRQTLDTEPNNPWGSAKGSVFESWQLDLLPSARNIWALLENQESSSVTNRVDEGGDEYRTDCTSRDPWWFLDTKQLLLRRDQRI